MTTAAADLVAAHALFGSAREVVAQRRAVYQIPIELLGDDPAPSADPAVLDHPITRGHLGEVLGGVRGYDRAQLASLAEPADVLAVIEGLPLRMASSPAGARVLTPAMRRISQALRRTVAPEALPVVLTRPDTAFAAAARRLREGVDLAVRLMPDLALDLLPHVALFAVLTRSSAGQLGSASAREYPGLIALPEPTSALEVAEAFVHEAAHQKFFDLAITRDALAPSAGACFTPSWAPSDRSAWPLEQAFAAFHAYRCLAAFMYAVAYHSLPAPGPPSLLPVAGVRADEIAGWLQRQGNRLGHDGWALLAALCDGKLPFGPRRGRLAPPSADERAYARCVGTRTLIALRDRPLRLVWQDGPGAAAPSTPTRTVGDRRRYDLARSEDDVEPAG